MKRILAFMLMLTLILLTCSCRSELNTYELNGKTFTIDTATKTVSDGTDTYSYDIKEVSEGTYIKITYPDNESYWEFIRGKSYNVADIGWSDGYAFDRSPDGGAMCSALYKLLIGEKSDKNYFVIMILLIIGLISAAAPRAVWYLEYGWRFKEAEPSEAAVTVNRIGGIIAVIIAVIMLFI